MIMRLQSKLCKKRRRKKLRKDLRKRRSIRILMLLMKKIVKINKMIRIRMLIQIVVMSIRYNRIILRMIISKKTKIGKSLRKSIQ